MLTSQKWEMNIFSGTDVSNFWAAKLMQNQLIIVIWSPFFPDSGEQLGTEL